MDYLTTIGLALWWFDTRYPLIVTVLAPITATGVLASSHFVWLRLVAIGEICSSCMVSAAATVIRLGVEFAILRRSDSPSLSTMASDLPALFAETNYAVALVPVSSGSPRAGMFIVTLRPLSGPVPFA